MSTSGIASCLERRRGFTSPSRWSIAAIALAALVTAASTANAAARFSITDIGLIPGTIASEATAINDLGQVAANAYHRGNPAAGDFTDGFRPFVWQSGAATVLPLPTGAAWAYASGINSVGDVVGGSNPTRSMQNGDALLWRSGNVQRLSNLPGGDHLDAAVGINTAGDIIGISTVTTPTGPGTSISRTYASLIRGGVVTSLPELSGSQFSFALAINEAGMIAGSNGNVGVVWTDLTPVPLPPGSFGIRSTASAINSSGDAAGAIAPPAGQFTAWNAAIWISAVPQLIGVPQGFVHSVGLGINDENQVIGFSRAASGPFMFGAMLPGDRAFLWEGGVFQELDSLIPSNSGWTLQRAVDINNLGQIVGTGIAPNGETRGFVLTPIPEPHTYGLMIAGLALVSYVARARKRCWSSATKRA